jgi:sugar lactone lactonase YvrE
MRCALGTRSSVAFSLHREVAVSSEVNVSMTPEMGFVAGGFRFPEGARWRDGSFWVSDMHTGEVFRIDPVSGTKEVVLQCECGRSSGIGWLPDGRLLVISMLDRLVLRLEPDGSTAVHADLSEFTPWPINDMLVDSSGVAFVGCFGFDFYGGAEMGPGPFFRVLPDGTVEVAAEDMTMANGAVMLPGDESTLVVAETWKGQLTAFDVDADHQLSGRRVWATVPDSTPDGICVDSEGGIWAASIFSKEFIRIVEGGGVTDRISTGDRLAIDCALGGPEGKTLFIVTADTYVPEETAVSQQGHVEAVEVSVAG